MKKEIREVKDGIMQVTCADERWYCKEDTDAKTGLPIYSYVPSVTWICDSYPKGIQYFKWLAQKGWDEAEAIKTAAADKGSRVHHAIKFLIDANDITLDTEFADSDGNPAPLSLAEWECVMSFVAWFKAAKPVILRTEFVVWGDGYAGTVDMLCEIGGVEYVVDYKTGQYIWPSYELQLSAYNKAMPGKERRLSILQLGYQRNKNGYKFTELEDKYDLFKAAKAIWANDHGAEKPSQKDYPIILTLK